MKRLAREPFLHFLLLGAALFALNAWRESGRPAHSAAPGIDVTASVVERLRAGYERQFNQPPGEEELRGLVAAHIREEIFYREALALGLERDDTIVRRRLAQKMEFLTADLAGAAQPEEAELERYFTTHAARYARPARMSFRHLYFSTARRGAEAEPAARAALDALRQGTGDKAPGDPFLLGAEFLDVQPEEIAAGFGQDFARQLALARAGNWTGPVASSYGWHLVRVEDRSDPRPVTLAEVRAAVERDWAEERRQEANREIFDKLKERYRIEIDESAMARAAQLPVNMARVTP